MALAVASTVGTQAKSSLSSIGSRLGGHLQQKAAALKVRYERQGLEIGGELSKLAKTHRPSRFAFAAAGLWAVIVDIANYFTTWWWVIDIFIALGLLLCLRALINRTIRTQRILGVLMLVSLFVPPLLFVVFAFGIWNPGAKVASVNKQKIQETMKQFQQSVQRARLYAARLTRIGRRTKGLRTITKVISKSKAAKTFSRGSKYIARMLGFAAADSVPYLSLIPFSTINVIWTYVDVKKADLEAREMLAEYREQEASAIAADSAVLRAQYTEQMTGIVQNVLEQDEISEAESAMVVTEQTESNPPPPPSTRPPVRTMRDIGTRAPVTAPRPVTQAPAQVPA